MNWRKRNLKETRDKWTQDVVYILTCYIENHLLVIYQSFTNHTFFSCCISFVNHLPIFYQLINNDFLMQSLCCLHYQWFTNHLLISLIIFTALPILLIVTNYYKLLYQCFTNNYRSDPLLYETILPAITN